MKKIMPNDKCPCMSGKKYKFCCSNRQPFLEDIKHITGGDYIDCEYILSDVECNSGIMKKYLNEILPSLRMKIIFAVNPSLNANMRSLGDDDGNFGIIIVKKVPIDPRDYFDLAHEFGHLLTKKKNYPVTRVHGVDVSAGTILTNTLMDPMINRMLIDYGFDFITYLKKGFALQSSIFERYPEEAHLELFQRHFIKCLIIEKELEWQNVDENVLKNEFKNIYAIKYPKLYKESLDFIRYAKTVGMDSPEKVKACLSKLCSDNKMNNYIELR